TSARAQAGVFRLHILHINDMHSRIESISGYDNTCPVEDVEENKCFGGVGRLATKVWERRNALRAEGANIATLDAADQAQGSLLYTTSKGKVEAEFMNRIGFDAMAVGNHEFDNGPDVLADFVEAVRFPVILGNVEIAAGERLGAALREWAVLNFAGEKVG